MRFVLATAGLPAYGNHGGAQTCMGLVRQMRNQGHEVRVLSLFNTSRSNPYLDHRPENERALRDFGVGVDYMDHDQDALFRAAAPKGPLAKFVRLSMAQAYPWLSLRDQVQAKLAAFAPDVVFGYHFEPLAAMHGLRGFVKIAGVGDPTHTPLEANLGSASPLHVRRYVSLAVDTHLSKRNHIPLMKELMAGCDAYGAFAAHYVDWFRSQGLPETHYFRTPIADPLSPDSVFRLRQEKQAGLPKPKILMIGDLTGTATLLGLRIFALKTLPRMIDALGPQGFEVHIVGRGTPPPDLRKALAHPAVVLRGRVDPADEEFLSSNILFVPTPTDLGIRVRIITGLSYGMAIVAHPANARGIPELRHDQNALLSDTGEGLADQLIRAVRSAELRGRLEREARRTFEQDFHETRAARAVVDLMERMAAKPVAERAR